MEIDRLKGIINASYHPINELTEWEQTILSDYADKLERFGDNVFISDKQEKYLERIAKQKLGLGTALPPKTNKILKNPEAMASLKALKEWGFSAAEINQAMKDMEIKPKPVDFDDEVPF